MNSARRAWLWSCLAAAALLAVPWRTHVDDLDAQIYLVVARNVARSHNWFDLTFGTGFRPLFREHLPFGLWPAAAAIRWLGEWAVDPIYALMTLGAVIAAGRIARRIRGPWAAVATILLLGTCEIIWHYGGRPLLEPPLLLLSTLAAGAALEERWAAAAIFGSLATLVKGPFGLLPLACASATKLRRPLKPALAVVLAVAPLALFLAIDPGGGWREHYLRAQLLGSAAGSRTDGLALWWLPFAVIARRFWPGLPFVLLGAWQARRDARLRPLLFTCAAMAVLLCLPARKWGNHTYVAFPLLGALAGCAAASLLERARPQVLTAAVAALACLFLASGLGSRIMRPPCAFSTSLAPALADLRPGTPILVVSKVPDDNPVAQLAAERDLSPYPATALPPDGPIRFAVARDGVTPPGWTELARGGGWSFLQR
jgi:hypothetical protein